MLNIIKKVALLSSIVLLSACAKGKDFYEKAVADLKGRLSNPDTMVVKYADGYLYEEVYYIRIGIEASDNESKTKQATFYYHSEHKDVVFDGENNSLYFVASLSSESHHYTYK